MLFKKKEIPLGGYRPAGVPGRVPFLCLSPHKSPSIHFSSISCQLLPQLIHWVGSRLQPSASCGLAFSPLWSGKRFTSYFSAIQLLLSCSLIPMSGTYHQLMLLRCGPMPPAANVCHCPSLPHPAFTLSLLRSPALILPLFASPGGASKGYSFGLTF